MKRTNIGSQEADEAREMDNLKKTPMNRTVDTDWLIKTVEELRRLRLIMSRVRRTQGRVAHDRLIMTRTQKEHETVLESCWQHVLSHFPENIKPQPDTRRMLAGGQKLSWDFGSLTNLSIGSGGGDLAFFLGQIVEALTQLQNLKDKDAETTPWALRMKPHTHTYVSAGNTLTQHVVAQGSSPKHALITLFLKGQVSLLEASFETRNRRGVKDGFEAGRAMTAQFLTSGWTHSQTPKLWKSLMETSWVKTLTTHNHMSLPKTLHPDTPTHVKKDHFETLKQTEPLLGKILQEAKRWTPHPEHTPSRTFVTSDDTAGLTSLPNAKIVQATNHNDARWSHLFAKVADILQTPNLPEKETLQHLLRCVEKPESIRCKETTD